MLHMKHRGISHVATKQFNATLCRGFKAYKQIVKLQFRMGKHDEMLDSYRHAKPPLLVVYSTG